VSYPVIRDSIQRLLSTRVPGVSVFAVANDDYQPLNIGTPRAVVFRYTSVEAERIAFGGEEQRDWVVALEIYSQFVDVEVSGNDMDDFRQWVMDAFAKYPKLDNTPGVLDAIITTGTSVPGQRSLGSVAFLQEDLTLRVSELVTIDEEE
jgi:hypothetical protein